MADIDVADQNKPIQGGTWGNKSSENFKWIPAAATTAGDKVLLTKMQKGTKLLDAIAYVEDAVTNLTLSLGYRYIDDTEPNGTVLTDNEAYFFSATAVAAGGLFRKTANNPPLELRGDAYLVLTLGAAVVATTNQVNINVDYDFVGLDR